MGSRTYMPTFARHMNKVGKYARLHQGDLIEFIENDEKLTDEEREMAIKAVKMMVIAYPLFKEYTRRL